MSLNSSAEICNLALVYLGNQSTVNDIESGNSKLERLMSLLYDNTRQALIRKYQPNFAKVRRISAKLVDTPVYGYTYAYEYPSNCLKLLGVGEKDEKLNYDYNIEANSNGDLQIHIDENFTSGIKIRYIADINNVSLWDANFKDLFAAELAVRASMPVTQDTSKFKLAQTLAQELRAEYNSLVNQENPMISVSESKFLQSRQADVAYQKQRR